jgi:hypothetical protein
VNWRVSEAANPKPPLFITPNIFFLLKVTNIFYGSCQEDQVVRLCLDWLVCACCAQGRNQLGELGGPKQRKKKIGGGGLKKRKKKIQLVCAWLCMNVAAMIELS